MFDFATVRRFLLFSIRGRGDGGRRFAAYLRQRAICACKGRGVEPGGFLLTTMRDFDTNADNGVRQHNGAGGSDAAARISATAPSRQGRAERRGGPPASSAIDLIRIPSSSSQSTAPSRVTAVLPRGILWPIGTRLRRRLTRHPGQMMGTRHAPDFR